MTETETETERDRERERKELQPLYCTSTLFRPYLLAAEFTLVCVCVTAQRSTSLSIELARNSKLTSVNNS